MDGLEHLLMDFGWLYEELRAQGGRHTVCMRRAALGMWLSEGVSQVEAAARLGCSSATVERDVVVLRRLLKPRATFIEEAA